MNFQSLTQNFEVPIERKTMYGEVNTPYSIIRQMVNLLPKSFIDNPDAVWVDPACGCGYFPIMIYNILMERLEKAIPEKQQRSTHIIENMLFMNEINEVHREKLINTFGKDCNLTICDYLHVSSVQQSTTHPLCIIGNPPYNSGGLLKVPTNNSLNKKKDGCALWKKFIKHSISLMKTGDYLCMIVPSLWMKPDKDGIYELLCKYKLHYIRSYTNTETNRIFHKKAQTPTCFFLLQKIPNDFSVSLYTRYLDCYKPYSYYIQEPIPLCGSSIVEKVKKFTYMYGIIPIIKTNMPRKNVTLSEISNTEHKYPNIHTCILKDKTNPHLVIKYSNEPCPHNGVEKLVLAHKMYGFPYYDKSGTYGISNRDSYIVTGNYNDTQYRAIQHFLSTKLSRYIYETTRYRMKFLEKYAFSFIPNIVHIPIAYDDTTTDDVLYEFFQFSDREIYAIETLHTKDFSSFS